MRDALTLGRRGFIAALSGAASACSPAELLNTTVSRKGYSVETDISFGPLPRQKLDFYKPDTPRPDGKAMVFFYGGGWRFGNKTDSLFVAQALAARGIAVVVPDYRLYPDVRFPAFVEDGALAMRWAADRLGPDRLFMMGHSAGAHIALMLAANTPYLPRAGVDRTQLRGVIGLAGPYDFLPLRSARLQDIFGGPDNPESQPITFARRPLPPALLIHGMADTVVLPRNSESLAAAWRAAGGSAELKLYPGVDHVDIVATFAELLSGRAQTRVDVLAYIDAH